MPKKAIKVTHDGLISRDEVIRLAKNRWSGALPKSFSEDVCWLQFLLKKHGFYDKEVDGVLGIGLRDAALKFCLVTANTMHIEEEEEEEK